MGPLVLVHGVGSSSAAWDPLIPYLDGQDLVAIDLPGFGGAPPLPPGQPASVPAHADFVERRLDEDGIKAAHLIGNSSGGWTALELARRGRASSVVALSPAGMWRGWERRYVFASLRLAHRLSRVASPVADKLMELKPLRMALWQYFAHPTKLSRAEAAAAIQTMGSSSSFDDFTAWTSTHSPAGLDEIDCPVLIAWGAKDRLLFRRQADRIVMEIPGADFRLLPGAGHVPMADAPGLVAEAIREFVGRVVPNVDPLRSA